VILEAESILKFFGTGVKNLLFPPVCSGCLEPLPSSDKSFCDTCFQRIAFIHSPKCPRCGHEFRNSTEGDHLCGTCLRRKHKDPFSRAMAVARYQEPVSTLLRSLKYDGDLSVLAALQSIVASADTLTLDKEDRIVPVPLHVKRLRSRGFNQAALIARLFFPAMETHILLDVVQRVRHTNPQMGLDGVARRKNLHDAFAVSNRSKIKGRKIILIDDVFTTGTTVLECSRVLIAAGAKEVQVLTVAKVQG